MRGRTSFATRTPGQIIAFGVIAIVLILAAAAAVLFINLPDADAFNAQVERIFVENDALTSGEDIRLLEILAQSGTAFSQVLGSYRFIIFVLMVFAAALLVAALILLVLMGALSRRLTEIERAGIQVRRLHISRDHRTVEINDMTFKLTDAAFETLSVLAEARIDNDILSGLALEATITGKSPSECDEASGATRIKRLRDHLGNQMVSELLVKTIARKGYTLSVNPGSITLD